MSPLIRRRPPQTMFPGVAYLLALPVLGGALAAQETPTKPVSPTQQQEPVSREALQSLEAVNRTHTEFRRMVLSELQNVASKRADSIDAKTLLITSCNDTAMLAGIGLDRVRLGAPGKDNVRDLERAQDKQPGGEGARDAASAVKGNDLGMIAVAGTALSIRSRPLDAGTPGGPDTQPADARETAVSGAVTLQPGYYVVRRSSRANAFDLVSLQERVVATIPARLGMENRGLAEGAGRTEPRPGEADDLRGQRPVEAGSRMNESPDWTRIYLDVLHAVDLEKR